MARDMVITGERYLTVDRDYDVPLALQLNYLHQQGYEYVEMVAEMGAEYDEGLAFTLILLRKRD